MSSGLLKEHLYKLIVTNGSLYSRKELYDLVCHVIDDTTLTPQQQKQAILSGSNNTKHSRLVKCCCACPIFWYRTKWLWWCTRMVFFVFGLLFFTSVIVAVIRYAR